MRPIALGMMLCLAGCGPTVAVAGTTSGGGGAPSTADCGIPGAHDLANMKRTAELGTGPAAKFAAMHDGDAVKLVNGIQGAFMVVPMVRLSAVPGDPEAACVPLVIHNALSQGEVQGGFAGFYGFKRTGSAFFSDPLFDPLGYDDAVLVGKTLALDIAADPTGFAAEYHVKIVLK